MKIKFLIGLLFLLSIINIGCRETSNNSSLPKGSPTETLKAFYTASKNRDPEEVKKTISKDSLKSLQAFAQRQNKSVDEVLRNPSDSPAMFPETRNEKISVNYATVEYKDESSGKWFRVPFVIEDNAWKIEVDKAIAVS